MATLQSIRNRSGLLVAAIGIGLVAFLAGDFMSSLGGSGGDEGIYVGEVLGEDVSRQEFEKKVNKRLNLYKSQNPQNELPQNFESQMRSEVWDQHVRELIMNNEYSKLGIDVSDEEWMERISGANIHPQILRYFGGNDGSTVDGKTVLEYLQNIDQLTAEQEIGWVDFQKQLIGRIKNEKYNALVAKAMYVTNEEAKVSFNEKSQNVTFNYVAIPFTLVADSTVKPTEDEIKTYYTKNKEDYKQDASKDVDFVVFLVVPSAEDDSATKSDIADLKADFASRKDYVSMARRYSDNTAVRFTFATKEELELESDTNWAELFTAEEGTVIGPYQVSQNPVVYRIAKLAAAQERPDSVEVRHIFIKPTQTMDADSVQARINAIKAQVEAGADFGLLAQKNSEDKASANTKGGDLGWLSEADIVNQFNINPRQISAEITAFHPVWQMLEDSFNVACFESKIEDLKVVNTLFGVHLIEITKRSSPIPKVKIAFIDKDVRPSTETFTAYENQANQFAGKILNEGIAFESLALSQNIAIQSDNKVTPDRQNIVGFPNSRKMVKWVNTAEQGAVKVFVIEDSYVVACFKKTYAEGITPLEDVKEPIKALVVKEKKAAHIIANIQAADLVTIAANHGQTLVSEQKANLANSIFQGSYEPELVGSIFGIPVGSISNPIEGSNAVYLIEVTAKDDKKTPVDFTQIKQEIQKGAANYAINAAYEVLKAKAEVKDNLSIIY
jgi:peptidyl-prolyl cis-trans isomerase D